MGLKKYLKFRVLFLLFFIIISLITINPKISTEGVAIKAVEKNSSASDAGITFDASMPLTQREIIKQVNNVEIKTLDDYANTLSSINETNIVRILTNKQEYVI